jgi:spore coat protein U-like protein
VNANTVAFGVYNPQSPAGTDSTGTIRVICHGAKGTKVAYTIQLGPGEHGTLAARAMRRGSDLLRYNLYRDAARTQVWGDGTAGSLQVGDAYVLTIPAENRAYTVYGRIFSGQGVRVGAYHDRIVVTLNF